MTARIYLPARSAMQSGQAKDKWVLEYEPENAARDRAADGLDKLDRHEVAGEAPFDTKEEAVAYAERNGIAYRVEEPKAASARSCPIPTISAEPGRSVVALRPKVGVFARTFASAP